MMTIDVPTQKKGDVRKHVDSAHLINEIILFSGFGNPILFRRMSTSTRERRMVSINALTQNHVMSENALTQLS